jgi:hypothetical protein
MVSGTIRGDYALAVGRNICHGSDSVESAKKEIALYVGPTRCVCVCILTKLSVFSWFPNGIASYVLFFWLVVASY